jgi:hypothetical protein
MRSVGKKGCCANRRTMCGYSPSVLTLVCIPAKRGSGTASTTRATLSDGTIMDNARIQAVNMFRLHFEACLPAAPPCGRGVAHGSATTHNASHQHASDSRSFTASVPRVIASDGEFSPKSGEGGGLKNRCRQSKKNAIGQVFACRILADCGEVAEWPKAAVC